MPRIRPHIPARAGCSATSKSTSEIVHFAILCQNYGRGHRAYALYVVHLAWAVHSGGARNEPAQAPSRLATFEAQRLYLPSLFPGSGSIRSRVCVFDLQAVRGLCSSSSGQERRRASYIPPTERLARLQAAAGFAGFAVEERAELVAVNVLEIRFGAKLAVEHMRLTATLGWFFLKVLQKGRRRRGGRRNCARGMAVLTKPTRRRLGNHRARKPWSVEGRATKVQARGWAESTAE